MKKVHVASGGEREPLTDSPFAGLRAVPGDVVAEPRPPAPEPAKAARKIFHVRRTRKGGLPVRVERRGGRWVTVVENAGGDLEAALARLKKRCGAGGTVRDDSLEVQGEQRDTVEAFLREEAELLPPA